MAAKHASMRFVGDVHGWMRVCPRPCLFNMNIALLSHMPVPLCHSVAPLPIECNSVV